MWTDTRLCAAWWRGVTGFDAAATPDTRPAPSATRSLAAAGRHYVFAWQDARDGRLMVSVRKL